MGSIAGTAVTPPRYPWLPPGLPPTSPVVPLHTAPVVPARPDVSCRQTAGSVGQLCSHNRCRSFPFSFFWRVLLPLPSVWRICWVRWWLWLWVRRKWWWWESSWSSWLWLQRNWEWSISHGSLGATSARSNPARIFHYLQFLGIQPQQPGWATWVMTNLAIPVLFCWGQCQDCWSFQNQLDIEG